MEVMESRRLLHDSQQFLEVANSAAAAAAAAAVVDVHYIDCGIGRCTTADAGSRRKMPVVIGRIGPHEAFVDLGTQHLMVGDSRQRNDAVTAAPSPRDFGRVVPKLSSLLS